MQEGGVEVKALKERPKITMWVQEYWDAFQVLSGSRIVHQGGVGPIPLSEMVAFMDASYLVDVDERLKFIRMIQSLDSIYVSHINDKAKRESKAKAAQRQAKRPVRKR